MSKSREFFYLDDDGKPDDAALHEPILAAGDAGAAFMGSTYPFLLRSGWTEEEIARAYPDLYRSSDVIR